MLHYGKPQILEVFKTLCPRLLFQIDNLRQAVETAKRILTKEKLDKQLEGWITDATPFLTMKEENEQRCKAVGFNESNVICAKTNKLTCIIV